MKKIFLKKIFFIALIAVAAVILTACQQPVSDDGGADYSDFAGNYRYTADSVGSTSGNLVFKENGTFSYVGPVKDAPGSGEYELGGDELVIRCMPTPDMKIEETFFVEKGGTGVKLTLKDKTEIASAIFLVYFNYGAGTSLFFTKS